jgi:hypothetical protein
MTFGTAIHFIVKYPLMASALHPDGDGRSPDQTISARTDASGQAEVQPAGDGPESAALRAFKRLAGPDPMASQKQAIVNRP